MVKPTIPAMIITAAGAAQSQDVTLGNAGSVVVVVVVVSIAIFTWCVLWW